MRVNRRELIATAAAAGFAAAGGGLSLGSASPAAAAPVVSVHLDVPYVDAHGAVAYQPPLRSAPEAGLIEPHELA